MFKMGVGQAVRPTRVGIFVAAILMSWPWPFPARSESTEDSNEALGHRQTISDWLYSDCTSNALPVTELEMDENARASFCQCFGDYFIDLLTEDEMNYLAIYRTPTGTLVDKADRANSICSSMQ